MKEMNLSPSQFADEIGIQRSGMSHLISGRNKPSLEFIMKVLKRFPDIKTEYLLFGSMEPGHPVKEANKKETETVAPVPATLFDLPEINVNKAEQKPQRPLVKKEREERKTEKIVIFYDDKTFREYEPETGSVPF